MTMPAERRNFLSPLEPVVYLDSTYTIAYFDTTERFHAECNTFSQRLETESVLPVISDPVYNELAFHHLKSALVAEGQRLSKSWIWVKRNIPQVFTAAMVEVKASKTQLERTTLRLSISDAVMTRAFQLMEDFHLLPTDAFHIATALEANVTAFVTLDRDFLAVDGIIVYTCLSQ
jgi:predicted nucleic acid-binding protein